MGLRGPCVRVGEGFGGFLGLREKVFFYFAIPKGAVLPPAGRVFLNTLSCILFSLFYCPYYLLADALCWWVFFVIQVQFSFVS
jgi:hypothetical protein